MNQESTVLLYTYNDIAGAIIIQDKLKSAGIEYFIENGGVANPHPMGGIKVKIFSKDLEAAEKIINE